MVKFSRTLIWSSDAAWRLNRIYNWYSTFESTARAKKVLKSIQELAKNIPSNPHKYPQCLDINPTCNPYPVIF
ncbi:MAG: type II toxin-antitoxin system RelE/ParE family toxin [Bacteroidota bacterium]